MASSKATTSSIKHSRKNSKIKIKPLMNFESKLATKVRKTPLPEMTFPLNWYKKFKRLNKALRSKWDWSSQRCKKIWEKSWRTTQIGNSSQQVFWMTWTSNWMNWMTELQAWKLNTKQARVKETSKTWQWVKLTETLRWSCPRVQNLSWNSLKEIWPTWKKNWTKNHKSSDKLINPLLWSTRFIPRNWSKSSKL